MKWVLSEGLCEPETVIHDSVTDRLIVSNICGFKKNGKGYLSVLNMDGTPSEMCLRAEKFARRLNGRFNVPFYTHDERLTTFEAKGERLVRGGQKGSYRDNPVDAIAAALLLQGWLDENTALFES